MKQELQVHIQSLHDMLEGHPVDDCTAASVRQTLAELQLALAQAEGIIPSEASNEELEKAALIFAEDHPAIAQVICQITNLLGNIGV